MTGRNPIPLSLDKPFRFTHPLGFCECGCGTATRIPKHSDASHGWVAGQPIRFVNGHQNRWRGPSIEVIDGGWTTPCHRWLRCLDRHGYGLIGVEGRSRLAHRVIFERQNGPIPPELEPDHLCRNRWCVNSDHLELVTRRVNARRGTRTILTLDQAREIKRSDEPYAVLMERFGVANSTIWAIRKGKNWTDA